MMLADRLTMRVILGAVANAVRQCRCSAEIGVADARVNSNAPAGPSSDLAGLQDIAVMGDYSARLAFCSTMSVTLLG